MNKEGIATLQHASMGLLCDPRKREEILNDLRVEWVRLVLELELVNIVRRRFPGHSEGAYGRLERWIDELGFIGSDVRFFAQRLWRVIVSWFWAGVFISSHRSDGPLDLKQFRNRFLFLFLFRFVARSLDNLADSLRHFHAGSLNSKRPRTWLHPLHATQARTTRWLGLSIILPCLTAAVSLYAMVMGFKPKHPPDLRARGRRIDADRFVDPT